MLTYSTVNKYFKYNPKTGHVYWKIQKGSVQAGTQVATKSKGHIYVCINYKRYPITHVIWLLKTGNLPKDTIDHINRLRDDNRWCNLREATFKEQQGNQSLYKNNTSGMRGVSYRKDRKTWKARLHTGKREIHLGTFKTKEEAHRLYQKAAKKYFGEFYLGE